MTIACHEGGERREEVKEGDLNQKDQWTRMTDRSNQTQSKPKLGSVPSTQSGKDEKDNAGHDFDHTQHAQLIFDWGWSGHGEERIAG
jgi:hypothetical protein